MAEYFGTHRHREDGTIEFGVMPEKQSNYHGFGRVEMIQQEVNEGRALRLDGVTTLGTIEFSKSRSTPYAWSWAICLFLDSHPRYQKRFRELGNHLVGDGFQVLANQSFAQDKALLSAEWDWFSTNLDYGWQIPQNAFQLHTGEASMLRTTQSIQVESRLGWQSTGLRIPAGREDSAGGNRSDYAR